MFLIILPQKKPRLEYLEIERHGDVNKHRISQRWYSPYEGGVILGHTNSSQLSLQRQNEQSNTLQRRFVLRFSRSDDVITKSSALSSDLVVSVNSGNSLKPEERSRAILYFYIAQVIFQAL